MKFLKHKSSTILSYINAAELLSFFESFHALMPITKVPPVADETPTAEECRPLGITNAELESFREHLAVLTDLNKVSRSSEETQEMNDVDFARDQLVIYLLNIISSKRRSPILEEKAAAVSLYLIAKPYRGIQRKANEQESALISGLLADLDKEGNPEKLETLGLTATVAKLKETNELYAALTAQRAAYQLSLKQQGTVKEIREILMEDYDYITYMAQAKYMLEPSDEVTLFITELNALLDRTETNYNRRIAAKPKEEEEGKGEWTPVNS